MSLLDTILQNNKLLGACIFFVIGIILLAIGSGFGALIITSFGVVIVVSSVVVAAVLLYQNYGAPIVKEKLSKLKNQ